MQNLNIIWKVTKPVTELYWTSKYKNWDIALTHRTIKTVTTYSLTFLMFYFKHLNRNDEALPEMIEYLSSASAVNNINKHEHF